MGRLAKKGCRISQYFTQPRSRLFRYRSLLHPTKKRQTVRHLADYPVIVVCHWNNPCRIMSSPRWNEWLKEQTPGTLKVDKNGTRALGYRRFRLGNLMAFAKRNKCLVALQPPFVTMVPCSPEEEGNESVPWPDHVK